MLWAPSVPIREVRGRRCQNMIFRFQKVPNNNKLTFSNCVWTGYTDWKRGNRDYVASSTGNRASNNPIIKAPLHPCHHRTLNSCQNCCQDYIACETQFENTPFLQKISCISKLKSSSLPPFALSEGVIATNGMTGRAIVVSWRMTSRRGRPL